MTCPLARREALRTRWAATSCMALRVAATTLIKLRARRESTQITAFSTAGPARRPKQTEYPVDPTTMACRHEGRTSFPCVSCRAGRWTIRELRTSSGSTASAHRRHCMPRRTVVPCSQRFLACCTPRVALKTRPSKAPPWASSIPSSAAHAWCSKVTLKEPRPVPERRERKCLRPMLTRPYRRVG